MWKGLATTELYEEFLRNGLCAEHSKEFILTSKNEDIVELRTELQRKALLFIRLRMFDPIVFQRPCVSSKLMDLLSREDGVPRRNDENLGDFIEKFTLFDSVLVFIICYFSRICCIGALFLRKTKLELNADVPLVGILQNVLEKKHLLESEINVLYPILQRNFNNFDPDQIRLTYVATLLFVRNYIKRKTLKYVTDQLAAELKMSTDCQELNVMGNEAFKKEQYQDAIELYASALSKNPYSYIILSNRAQAYKKVGKYKESQLDSYLAVTINPTWCLGYCKLSSSLYVQKLYDDAFIVAEYGLAKCKNGQTKDYETLESIKMEASFKRSLAEPVKESTSKSSSPRKNVADNISPKGKELEKEKDTAENMEKGQSCTTSNQNEREKETEVSKELVNESDHAPSNKEHDIKPFEKSEKITPNCAASEEPECQSKGETPEKLKKEIDSSTPKKADEIQEVPDEKMKQEKDLPPQNANVSTSKNIESSDKEMKTESPSKEDLKIHPSPQEDIPPLLEAPESDDSYSEAVPPLMEAPESDDTDSDSEEVPPLLDAPESDDSYYEVEGDADLPSPEVSQEESSSDSNASQQEQKENFEQNLTKPYPDTNSSAAGVTNQSSQNPCKSCGTSDDLLEKVEKQISLLTESLTSKVTYIESSVIPYAESTSTSSGVTNQHSEIISQSSEVTSTSQSSSQNPNNSSGTSDGLLHDMKMATSKDTTEGSSKNVKSIKVEKTVTKDSKDNKPKSVNNKEEKSKTIDSKEEKPKIVDNKEEKPKIVDKKEEKPKIVDTAEEIKPDIDVGEKNNKKNDKKSKPAQVQSLSGGKKNSKFPKKIEDDTDNGVAEIHSLLKEGSEALANDCGDLASRYFQKALSLIRESPQIYGFQECDIVCIKYACAKAFYISGEYSDLQKCIDILQEIFDGHESISFPTAYYGLALAFAKLNRFKDSLNYSKLLQEILNKGIRLKVYPWPGMTQPIPETKAETLKTLIKQLIEECENPPKPAAICRHENCPQPHIYYSDPDFKGFICVSCSENCCLQYHITCWKSMKTDLSLSDKDFLYERCLTPDCIGLITQVKNIDKEGNTGKVFAANELKKPQKMKKPKPEKKYDLKEEKRKRRRHSRCDSVSSASEAPSHEDLNPSSSSSKLSQCETESEVSSSALTADLEIPETASNSLRAMSEDREDAMTRNAFSKTNEKNSDIKTSQLSPSAASEDVNDHKSTKNLTMPNEQHSEIDSCATQISGKFLTQKSKLSVDADPFYGAKVDAPPDSSKNAEIIITKSKPATKKGKILKCSTAETSNEMDSHHQHSEAFWSTHEAEDFPPLPSENSSHYSADHQNFNEVASTTPDTYVTEMIEKNIFSYLEDFLSFHGPLMIDDPILTKALNEFPTEANILIADCGGISEFLKKNIRFAVVGESYVCVVKDVVSAYNLFSRRSLPEETDCHDLLNNVEEFSSGTGVQNSNFPAYLNPNATEYRPFFSTGTEYDDSVQKSGSSKINEHNSESIMSVVNSLRQPLCVDEDNIVKNSNCDSVAKVNSESFNSEIVKTAHENAKFLEPLLEGEVVTNCIDENAIAVGGNVVAEKTASKRTQEKENISGRIVEKFISKKTVEENISERIVEENISERIVEENISEETSQERISEETVQEEISEELELENSERTTQDKISEIVQEEISIEQENNSEATVQERISEEVVQEDISKGQEQDNSEGTTQERIFQGVVAENIHDEAARDTASSINKPAARISEEDKTTDDETNIQKEKWGNVWSEVKPKRTLRKLLKTYGNTLQLFDKGPENCEVSIPERVAVACQTENIQQAIMISKGTMKNDESLDRMKEIIGLLQDKERVSLEKYKLLEIKYIACLEEMHKQYSNFKNGNDCAEKELNTCKVAKEENVEKTAENEKLRNEVKTLQKSLNELREEKEKAEKEHENLSMELQRVKESNIEFQERQAEMEKALSESREKYELLENKELSLRTESQSTFRHLNELVASLTNEKLESIKRAAKSELNVLQLKKAEVLNRIDSKMTEAEQKVEQLKEGISLVPLDPVITKNIEALISQINNHYKKDLCAIRADYTAKMDKHIKEVESGTHLEKLKIDEMKDLPEIPQLTSPVLVPSSTFNPATSWPTASSAVDPAYLKMASAYPPIAAAPTLHPIGTKNSIAAVPIASNVPTNIAAAAAVPESASVSASTFKKLPPGISSSFVNLPSKIPSGSLVSKPSHELSQSAQLNEMSKKGNAKSKIVSSESLSSSSSVEGKGAAAKFSDSSLELGYSLKGLPQPTPVTTGSQGKNSYEKLLIKLVEKFPNYTQVQLMSFIKEFRERRQGKLSGLTLDAIVTQVGALIQSKQTAAKVDSSKVPEVITKARPSQNKVSGKKLIVDLKAREQPVEVPPVKKKNPWGNGASDSSKKWSGDTLEECAICCEEFLTEKSAYKVDCGHCFHIECIREWLNKKSDCPICRVHLLLPEDYPSLT